MRRYCRSEFNSHGYWKVATTVCSVHAEKRSVSFAELRTPQDVQRFINRLPYNTEPNGDTLRGFRGVVKTGKAHCLEAALVRRLRAGTAWLPAAPVGAGVGRPARPRHLRLQAPRPLGLGGALPRSGSAWAEARVPLAARARRELLRPLHRLHRLHQRLLGGASRRYGQLRLAIVEAERLGRGEHADRPAAPEDQAVKEAGAPGAGEVQGLRREA